jgi:hypothetical protein
VKKNTNCYGHGQCCEQNTSSNINTKSYINNHPKQAHQQQNAANPSLNMIEQSTQRRGNTQ